MTLPEDVRKSIRSEIDNIMSEVDLINDQDYIPTRDNLVELIIDLLTTTKAEGYQEGVKAMGEKMKALTQRLELGPYDKRNDRLYITNDWDTVGLLPSAVDHCADQILNPQGEEK